MYITSPAHVPVSMQLKLTQTTYAKMTGETPEVCSDKRKPREDRLTDGHRQSLKESETLKINGLSGN